MTRSESMKIGRRQHRRMLRAGIACQEDGQPQVGAGCARNVGNHTALAIRLCTSPAPRRSQILNYGTFGTVSAGTGCTATTGFETRDAPEDVEAQRAAVVCGQVGDEPVRAGAPSSLAPATGRTRCDESQRAGQPTRLIRRLVSSSNGGHLPQSVRVPLACHSKP